MHILIDIGNSTVVVAIAEQEGNIIHTWRFKTRKEETVSFFRYELKQGLRKYGVEPTDVESVTISSVVPEVDDDIAQAVNDLTGIVPHFFSINDADGLISIDIESPTQLGKDRLADAIGAVSCYGVPAIIIDFGKRMGFEKLVPFKTPEEVWAEYQKCQEGTDMQMASYRRLREGHGFTWPVAPDPDSSPETYIRYAEGYDPYVKQGEGIKFYCRKNNRAVIYARPQIDAQEMPDAEYPFFLTTGRMLEHWHTATMTGNVPELKNAAPEMYVEVNEEDAKRLGINEGDLVIATLRFQSREYNGQAFMDVVATELIKH